MEFLIHGPPRWKEDQIYAPGLFLTPKISLLIFRPLTYHSYHCTSKKIIFLTQKISDTTSRLLTWNCFGTTALVASLPVVATALYRWSVLLNSFMLLIVFALFCFLFARCCCVDALQVIIFSLFLLSFYCLFVCCFVFNSPVAVVTMPYRWSVWLNTRFYVIACLWIVLFFIRPLLWRRWSTGVPLYLTFYFHVMLLLVCVLLLCFSFASCCGDGALQLTLIVLCILFVFNYLLLFVFQFDFSTPTNPITCSWPESRTARTHCSPCIILLCQVKKNIISLHINCLASIYDEQSGGDDTLLCFARLFVRSGLMLAKFEAD